MIIIIIIIIIIIMVIGFLLSEGLYLHGSSGPAVAVLERNSDRALKLGHMAP